MAMKLGKCEEMHHDHTLTKFYGHLSSHAMAGALEL